MRLDASMPSGEGQWKPLLVALVVALFVLLVRATLRSRLRAETARRDERGPAPGSAPTRVREGEGDHESSARAQGESARPTSDASAVIDEWMRREG